MVEKQLQQLWVNGANEMIFQFFSKLRNRTILTDSLSKQDLQEIYAAQEDAWYHHQTDNFPAPLNDKN